jgi:tetratricopeptide (TPR) repeat protein
MSTADGGNVGQRERRESLTSALVQVALVALVLGAAVVFVVHRGRVRQEAEGHFKAAQALALRGNPADLSKALQELDVLFAVDANQYGAQTLAADLQAELWLEHHQPGAEAQAREHLARAEALESKDMERYGAKVVRAWVLLAEGKAPEADAALKALRERGAGNPRLWLAQGRTSQALGDLQGARQAYSKASEGAWKDPRFATAYGEALLDEGLFAQAHEALGRALGTNPEYLQAQLSSALVLLYMREQPKEAERALQEVGAREAELTPGLKAREWVVRSELALAQGTAEEALKAADAALAVVPNEPLALFSRARALAAKKDPGARAAFEAAVAQHKTSPLLYLEGAKTLQQTGDGAGALALLDAYGVVFQSGLEKDDRYWLSRGGILEMAGQQDVSLAAYEKAIAVKGPALARAQYAKGMLLLTRKDYAKAREALATVTPDAGTGPLPEAYTAMGETLFGQGDYATGSQHYFIGLSREHGRNTPLAILQARAADIGKQLTAAGQATVAKTWKTETDALLAR